MIIQRGKLKKILKVDREVSKDWEGIGYRPVVIGITNGVFDILHCGHVNFIREAKQMCDYLIVSLNTDESVRKNKGDLRPITPLMERIQVIDALRDVDYTTWHDEPTMLKTIEMLKPDLYIKGGDYTLNELTSAQTVLDYGGDVQIVPFRYEVSTTEIINRIKGK